MASRYFKGMFHDSAEDRHTLMAATGPSQIWADYRRGNLTVAMATAMLREQADYHRQTGNTTIAERCDATAENIAQHSHTMGCAAQ